MVKFITYASILMCILFSSLTQAQETVQDTLVTKKEKQISDLKEKIDSVIAFEKRMLKFKVDKLNKLYNNGTITKAESDIKKEDAAKKAALNIENKTAILKNTIELIERDIPFSYMVEDNTYGGGRTLTLGTNGFKYTNHNKKPKEDIKTTSDLVIAFGLNNAIIEGQSIDNSPYEIGGSRFFEIGYMFTTRVLPNSNAIRFKYGLNFQFNGLNAKDNTYFVRDGDLTHIEEFPTNIKKAKLRMDNLVLPVIFEFGGWNKRDYKGYYRYNTNRKFKVGVGGYAGLNLSTRQKLKYTDENGDSVRQKIRNNYNTNNFIYGVMAYVGHGDFALYAKYDLNEVFTDGNIKQNNVSLGLRLEL